LNGPVKRVTIDTAHTGTALGGFPPGQLENLAATPSYTVPHSLLANHEAHRRRGSARRWSRNLAAHRRGINAQLNHR